MHLATLHSLARQLAQAPGPSGVLYEPVARLLNTRALTPLQKGLIASVFAGAVWPRDLRALRTRSRAPRLPPPSPLALPPPLRRRHPRPCWLPADTLAAALVADPSHPNCVFTTGRCIADPTSWPAPSTHFESIFQLADQDGTLRTVTRSEWEQRQHLDEVCYVDGACYPHVIPSLSRAGWAGIFLAQGKVTATAYAPVWHPRDPVIWSR